MATNSSFMGRLQETDGGGVRHRRHRRLASSRPECHSDRHYAPDPRAYGGPSACSTMALPPE